MNYSSPFVSIIIPCRNEEHFITQCIEGMIDQDYSGPIEILVAEGESDDTTPNIIRDLATRFNGIRIIPNEKRIVPTGLNLAILEARGEIIVRIDVHTKYARNYVRLCVETLQDTGAANVGGPWRVAPAISLIQDAISGAFQSSFSSGGALSHSASYEGFVDTVYLGCWLRKSLIEIGLFDEDLVRNQDDELNFRLVQAGHKIWQTPKIISWYTPRTSLYGLFRQYRQYGYWKVRVLQKHRRPASIRHVAPTGALIICLLLLGSSPFSPIAFALLITLASLYTVTSLVASAIVAMKKRNWRLFPLLPLVFAVFHVSYAIGFLQGVFDFMILGRGSARAMTQLSR